MRLTDGSYHIERECESARERDRDRVRKREIERARVRARERARARGTERARERARAGARERGGGTSTRAHTQRELIRERFRVKGLKVPCAPK